MIIYNKNNYVYREEKSYVHRVVFLVKNLHTSRDSILNILLKTLIASPKLNTFYAAVDEVNSVQLTDKIITSY